MVVVARVVVVVGLVVVVGRVVVVVVVTRGTVAGGCVTRGVLVDDEFPLSRDELMAECAARRISTRRGIMAAHLEPACARFADVPLPVTERLTHHSLVLPLFHDLTESDQDRVIDVLLDAAR